VCFPARSSDELEEKRRKLMDLRSTGKKDGSVGLATQAMKQESMHEVESAFRHRKAMFGPFEPGICGAVMADFMHQWLEGMAKHVIDWVTLLVEATGTGTLADFDARFAHIEVRHSDTTTPTKPFANGVSKIKSLPCKEVVPLLMQLPIAIGVEGTFLSRPDTEKVFTVIDRLLRLLDFLCKDSYRESEINALDRDIKSFLKLCKSTFGTVQTTFRFFKFHMATCSAKRGIKWFGRMALTDSNRWEALHTEVAKRPWERSSKRNGSFIQEMMQQQSYTRKLQELVQKQQPVAPRKQQREQRTYGDRDFQMQGTKTKLQLTFTYAEQQGMCAAKVGSERGRRGGLGD
jgi:hypothetical protein